MSEPRVAVVQPAISQDATRAKLPSSECLSLGYLVAALRQEGLDATPLDADLMDIPNDAGDADGCVVMMLEPFWALGFVSYAIPDGLSGMPDA